MASSSVNRPAAATPTATDSAQKVCHWILTGALAIVFVAQFALPEYYLILDAVLLVLAVAVSITTLNRQIPMQNVLLGVSLAALIGGVAHGLSAFRGLAIPFGPIFFHETCGAEIFGLVPWTIPLLWVVALFSSRGTARLILRPWRKLKSYGYWLIGLTAVLIMAFDFALEPFATTRANDFWTWPPTKFPVTWYGASPLNFLGWVFVALLILGFTTPALIKKRPGSRTPLELNPLGIWLGAIILFAVGCAKAALWPAVAADATIAIVTLAFAIPGARW
jgi:uncharacterized membrane protein